ncbi:MAG: MotA/TolQ/ExbB proton channel family protein [Acidobacteria bacterium]|nr:MotA/TolQ/ExbB proton channel family protein [Acidobacteriota bacterium]
MRRLGRLIMWAAGVAVIGWAYVRLGGSVKGVAQFVQWPAVVIVGGGTALALVVSYPGRLLWQAARAVRRAFTEPPKAPDDLIPVFAEWASRAKRSGIMAVEREVRRVEDPFLSRALALTVSGVDGLVVRQTLEVDHHVSLERDEEYAQVLESAGGYAPTLGIIAAVLGLMRAMQDLSSPTQVGAGIAAAFVATLYGLGAANLVFLPLATRLRTYARQHALRREFTIDGVLALHGGLHPSMMEERLTGYVTPSRREVDVA